MLEFCFHDLSPRNIGATLVWCLAEPSAEEWDTMRPNFELKDIETRVGSDRSVAVLRHLLTYTENRLSASGVVEFVCPVLARTSASGVA